MITGSHMQPSASLHARSPFWYRRKGARDGPTRSLSGGPESSSPVPHPAYRPMSSGG